MEGPARIRLVALVVLVAVAVPIGIVLASDGGDGQDEPAALRVERSAQLPELVVYVEAEANTPERSGGRRSIAVECVTADGSLIASQAEPWPFTDTDQGTRDPHAHLRIDPASMLEVDRCRLRGTEPLLEAPVQ